MGRQMETLVTTPDTIYYRPAPRPPKFHKTQAALAAHTPYRGRHRWRVLCTRFPEMPLIAARAYSLVGSALTLPGQDEPLMTQMVIGALDAYEAALQGRVRGGESEIRKRVYAGALLPMIAMLRCDISLGGAPWDALGEGETLRDADESDLNIKASRASAGEALGAEIQALASLLIGPGGCRAIALTHDDAMDWVAGLGQAVQ